MVKTKFNPAEYRQKLEKKLNTVRIPGFKHNALFEQGNDFVEYAQDVKTEQLLDLFESKGYKYVGRMCPLHKCICVVCNSPYFQLLKLPTLWAKEPYFGGGVYYFKCDEKVLNYLEENLKSKKILVYAKYGLTFNKYKIPKLCPDWSKYRLTNLPTLTEKYVDQIINLDEKIVENEDLYFQINNPNGTYRMPVAIAGMLGKNVLSINAHISLEQILAIMSTSTAILDNYDENQSYISNYKTFYKNLKFVGRKEPKENIITKTLKELVNVGLIDSFNIENDKLYFSSATITKHIRQQIKRPIGFYENIPATKQAPFIATFINYLWWIINSPAHYERITISLETLTKHLGLERLLNEHRLREIAKILNLLRCVGADYGLLQMPEVASDITSKDVKYLLNNKTELHKFIILKVQPKAERENK